MSLHNRQDRHLPVRPNLDQLKHQAKDMLRDIQRADPSALEEFNQHHPKPVAPDKVKLADAQLALARSYKAPSWPRLLSHAPFGQKPTSGRGRHTAVQRDGKRDQQLGPADELCRKSRTR